MQAMATDVDHRPGRRELPATVRSREPLIADTNDEERDHSAQNEHVSRPQRADEFPAGAEIATHATVEQANRTLSITGAEADILKEVLSAKLVELRREISHTDSPRFRDTLYQVEGVLKRVLEQLPTTAGVTTKS
jgi:hypothetical protein